MPDVGILAAAHAAFVRGKLASARFAQELTRVNAEPVEAPPDLEALVRAAMLRDDAHVVEHRAGVEQLRGFHLRRGGEPRGGDDLRTGQFGS